jgi:hypothetical protein
MDPGCMDAGCKKSQHYEYVRTDRLCEVAHSLYLSSQYGEQDRKAIEDCGITHVLQVITAKQATVGDFVCDPTHSPAVTEGWHTRTHSGVRT